MPGDTVKTLDSGDRTRSRRFVLEGPVHLPACLRRRGTSPGGGEERQDGSLGTDCLWVDLESRKARARGRGGAMLVSTVAIYHQCWFLCPRPCWRYKPSLVSLWASNTVRDFPEILQLYARIVSLI